MFRSLRIVLLALAFVLAFPATAMAGIKIKNPYTTDGNWWVVQLHFHTTNSDGTGTPAQMAAAYFAAGYHMVFSTDHVGASYPADGDGFTADPGGHDPMIWVPAEEETLTGWHMNCLGNSGRIQTPWVAPRAAQVDVDATIALGGIVMINHPVTYAAWDWWTELLPLKRYSLIECINAPNIATGNDWIPGIDLWDEYNQVWGTSTDDAHNATTQVNKYCVVVQTASAVISQADILSSLDSGNFYMRQTAAGPVISSVTVSGATITITLPAGNYTVTWKKKNNLVAETDTGVTTTASYTCIGTEGYIRAEISNGTLSAYTQPLFVMSDDTDISAASASSGGTAANLIDNDVATVCDLGAATGTFDIDVGSIRVVNGIQIQWYIADSRRFNYKILESSTGAFAGEETEVIRTTYSNRASTTLDVMDVYTRYLRVTVTGLSVGAGNAIIREVEVYHSSPETSYYYIQNVTGLDTNDGLTPASAWKTHAVMVIRIRPRKWGIYISSGATYGALTKIEDYKGNLAWGKHPEARWVMMGSGWPQISTYGMGNTISKYWTIRGFYATGTAGAASFTIIAGSWAEIIYNIGAGVSRYGAYIGTGACPNATVAYNYFYGMAYNAIKDYNAAGCNTFIYNNIGTISAQYGCITGYTAHLATIRNNIFWGNATSDPASYKDVLKEAASTLTDSNNCIGTYSGTWAKTNNVDLDPKFVNAATYDFRLRDTSPVLGKGYNVGLTADILGHLVPASPAKSPDIGAYECVFSSRPFWGSLIGVRKTGVRSRWIK